MSVNKVILLGYVGADPVIRYVEKGLAVATFSLATSEQIASSDPSSAPTTRTEWHQIVGWRHWAQQVERYVRKGTQVYLEGKLRTRIWVDQYQVKRSVTEVYIDEMQVFSRGASTPFGGASVGKKATSASPTQPQAMSKEDAQALLNNTADKLPF